MLNSNITHARITDNCGNIAGTTLNDYSLRGLNVYQITPKSFTYKMAGYSSRTSSLSILGTSVSSLTFANTETFGQFGIGNARAWYIYAAAGSTVPRNFSYDYVNSAGDLITNATVTVTATGTAYVLAGGNSIASVNSFRQLASPTTSDNFYITSTNSATNAYTVGGVQAAYQEWQSVITVPNNCIGYVTNISAFSSYDARCGILKWDTSGYRTIEYSTLIKSGALINTIVSSGYEGSLGGIIRAGQTIALARFDSITGGATEMSATVVIKYLS